MSPATRADLLRHLDSLGIANETVDHPAVFTVEESRALNERIPGMHSKNLFFKDAGDRLWLLTAEADRRIDLKTLHARIGAKRLSFGKPELLMRALGVTPGSVTPFALINDREHQVSFVLDTAMLRAEFVNFHPLENTATTRVTPAGFKAFLKSTGHALQTVELGDG
ncbi:MAG: prolyl-tRNA synthetase associated domain-containing protein [Alphaproteobacteria bacterium]|nr:prolyl-tRNA synthetase associated domain-containing protein [Alphaproteobacteria bacterium]